MLCSMAENAAISIEKETHDYTRKTTTGRIFSEEGY